MAQTAQHQFLGQRRRRRITHELVGGVSFYHHAMQ
jgi:hypothetical protein